MRAADSDTWGTRHKRMARGDAARVDAVYLNLFPATFLTAMATFSARRLVPVIIILCTCSKCLDDSEAFLLDDSHVICYYQYNP